MPVAMTTSSKPEPKRTKRSTQDLPIHPTVEEMETSEKEKVLRWIQRREPNLLKDGDLKNFNEANFTGSAFLLSSCEFFRGCKLSPGASLVLDSLVNEVKEGKFIPRT
jgi:hypothetical protein